MCLQKSPSCSGPFTVLPRLSHAQCGSDPLTSLQLQFGADFFLFPLPLPRLTQHKAVNLSDIKLNRSQEFAQLSARPEGLEEEAWQPR